MSLSDEIEVRISGNLCQPITLITRGALTLATTIIGASPVALVSGQMAATPVYLPLEVRGASNAAAFAARAGLGSRVIVRGTLEQQPAAPHSYVVVVERLLYVAPPATDGEEI
jgi:hypothetical protein